MCDARPLDTTASLAAYLRCSPRQVTRLVERGVLPALRVGRQLRFDRQEAIDALKQQTPPDGPRAFA